MIQPKPGHKRPASAHDEQETQEQHPPPSAGPGAPLEEPQQQQQLQTALPPRHAADARGDLWDEGGEKAAKSLRITTSKILGTAQPRRPRIGPQFQADLPPGPAAGGPEIPARPLPLHRQLQLAREVGLRARQQAEQQQPPQQGGGGGAPL